MFAVAVIALAMPMTGMAGESKGKHALQMMDTNGDGQLSAEEHAAEAAKRFAEMDINGDGMVTRAELKERNKKHKQDKKGEDD